jgi:hypothetical protein
MEDINNRGSTAATFEKKVIQPRLVIQALAFTGIYTSALVKHHQILQG